MVMKKIEQHRLNNNWQHAQKIWTKEKSKRKLNGWKLKRSNDPLYIGLCSYNDKTIFLSSYFMRGYTCNYAKVKASLLHEVAHAISPGHGHDRVWKKRCERIGGDSCEAGTVTKPGMNWAISCRQCKWRQEYYYQPDVRNKVCGKCRYPVRLKYII
uniref:SprT-like family protein n=1 Tax=Pithovirus LCPAC302 TaxID=2506593 RepID=A0A481Z805_9VIRU|nr:MAG: SprT-like family protein [Pithovirus LCPAC302]